MTGLTRELTERRAAGLVAFQGERLASAYVSAIQRVWDAEPWSGATR